MSGYTDDYEDRGNREPERERPAEGDDRLIERIKSRVKGPAIALLISGVLSLVGAGMGVVNYITYDAQVSEAMAKMESEWEKDPNMTPQQRQEARKLFTSVFDAGKVAIPITSTLLFITSIVTIIGSIQMMKLSSRGLAMIGSLMSMIPIVNGVCCVIGIPFGLWALITLMNSEVKEGFSAAAQAARGPRDEY